MKHHIALLLTCVIMAFAVTATAADTMKIATIDISKVAQDCKDGAEATKTLKAMADKAEKNLKAKQQELERLKAGMEGKKPLTEKERNAKEIELKKKFEKYREFTQNAQKSLQDKETELGTKIFERVEKVIKEYALKNSYALVVRKNGMLYNDIKIDTTDITYEILALVDAPPAAPATEIPKK